jgi:hypothetical protein
LDRLLRVALLLLFKMLVIVVCHLGEMEKFEIVPGGEVDNCWTAGLIQVYYRISRSEETAGTGGSGRARYPLLWGSLARQDLVTVGSLVAQFQGQDSIQQRWE